MALAVFAVVMVAYGLVAARLERLSVGPALAFTLAGLVIGGAGLDVFHFALESESLIRLAELTLAIVLFNDAASMNLKGAGRDAPLIVRLLGVGLPLSIGLGALAALVLFPGTGLAVALLVGAILAPTDAALASQIVTDTRVPGRVRRVLNVESGLNDGIASPFVVLFTVIATSTGGVDGWIVGALRETGTAVVVGGLVGAAGAWLLVVADAHAWTSSTYRQVAYGALALAAFGLSDVLGGNGFIAAFVAGIAFRRVGNGRIADAQHLTEGLTVLMSVLVWLLFGAVLAGSVIADGIVVAAVVYAVLSLTVVRMVPVAVALAGAHLRREPVLFIGWFGPRGLASIAFGLTAVVSLEEAGVGAEVLAQTVTWTVLLSVVLHGLSAAPLAGRFGRDATEAGGIEEVAVAARPRWQIHGVEPPQH
jgi:NhaP-type Na+/H+ or K+/H+ antiporter